MNAKVLFKLLLGLSAVLIIALGFGVKYGLDKISAEKSAIGTLLAELQVADEKLTLTIKTQTQLEQLGFIQTIADEVLPDEKTQPELVGQILLIAQNNDVDISNLTFSGQTTGRESTPDITQATPLTGIPGVYTIPLSIKIEGEYDDMLGMLRDLEQNRRKIQTNSVTIRPVLGDNGEPTSDVTADILIDVYVRPNIVEVPTEEGAES